MSSINTNVSAMQALQSLNNTNQSLETTQQRISTGYKVGDAKDNAAIWSVAQVMRSDVSGFGAISEQLSLGESTVAVARNASETVSDLVGQIKERVISGQGDNVDRDKIQNDINELVGQVQSVVDAAQFNGTNLLKDNSGAAEFDILSSLDRDSSQQVTASDISVNHQNLQTKDTVVTNELADTNTSATANGTYEVEFSTDLVGGGLENLSLRVAGETYEFDVSGAATGTDLSATLDNIVTAVTGSATYTDGTNGFNAAEGHTIAKNGTNDGLLITSNGGNKGDVQGVTLTGSQVGLHSLSEIDVTSKESAAHALESMEAFTQKAIDAASNFGSAQMRVETQMNFVSKLSDSLEAGVGSLVDANMTEESAKLNALQVQQQLGTQALSIANQSPQNLLSLFR